MVKYPLEWGDHLHVHKLTLNVSAPGHVPLSYHEVEPEDPFAPLSLSKAARLRVRASRDDQGKAAKVPYFLIQDGKSYGGGPWQNQPDGSQLCTELPPGTLKFRVVWHDTATGTTWFSPVTEKKLLRDEDNELDLTLTKAATLSGSLDSSVPRPVKDGRVNVYSMPAGDSHDFGLLWMSGVPVTAEGTFVVPDCPPDCDARVAVVCTGYFSTSVNAANPTTHSAVLVPANSLGVPLTLEMSPTASLVVTVLGPDGKPASGVAVSSNPNTSFGPFSTIYGSTYECQGAKFASVSCDERRGLWKQQPVWTPDKRFNQTTGADGKVRLVNLPECQMQLEASSDALELPPVRRNSRDYWRRWQQVTLKAGEETAVILRMVKVGTTTIPEPGKDRP
jgi:hypothetical protein